MFAFPKSQVKKRTQHNPSKDTINTQLSLYIDVISNMSAINNEGFYTTQFLSFSITKCRLTQTKVHQLQCLIVNPNASSSIYISFCFSVCKCMFQGLIPLHDRWHAIKYIINNQSEADIQLLETTIGLHSHIHKYKGAVNMAEAQVWDNCSNNSRHIISLSQCHFEISAHSYFLFFDYWY